ncbi:MAG: hypothetical protein U0X75_15945 [Acidobacteriota bacterium]
MKKIATFLSTAGLLTILAVGALAQTPADNTPRIRNRQIEQQRRIGQGVRSGELTRREARRLEHNQREINQEKREAKSDGVVTRDERQDIRRDQNRANRQIYRAKHNRRDRN